MFGEPNVANLINVGLYGQGNRNSRLRAEYVYCKHAGECSAYKEGKCFNVTTLFGNHCHYGHINRVDGGTKRAKSYQRVYDSAKANEQYGKLKYPNAQYITKIGDNAFLTLPYVDVKSSGDKLFATDAGLSSTPVLAQKGQLTPENLNRICAFHPYGLMATREIMDYQKKIVPLFLRQLKDLFPEQYAAFCTAYPDYEAKMPDYRGRYAKLVTCNRDCTYTDTFENVFRFEGDYVVCDNCRLGIYTPFSSDNRAQVRMLVDDKMRVKITDNEQVTEHTIFL